MSDPIKRLALTIKNADAVLVGIGSGLSSAAGFNHYHWSPALLGKLKDFYQKYGFASPFQGFYYLFANYESQWGYYSKYISFMQEAKAAKPYLELKQILQNKEYFVITTNIDSQVLKTFDKEKIWLYQGDFAYLQCSQPCHDMVYEDKALIKKMTLFLDKELKVSTSLIPRCKKCGRVMVPWVRDDTFLEGERWHREKDNYTKFLSKYLTDAQDKKLVLLELGVGEMTPSIIKLPFWQMTHKNKNVFYACLNSENKSLPLHLENKGIYIKGDLKDSLSSLLNEIENYKD